MDEEFMVLVFRKKKRNIYGIIFWSVFMYMYVGMDFLL